MLEHWTIIVNNRLYIKVYKLYDFTKKKYTILLKNLFQDETSMHTSKVAKNSQKVERFD